MAKMPGWIKVESQTYSTEPPAVQVRLRVRWWHPGLWLALWRHARGR